MSRRTLFTLTVVAAGVGFLIFIPSGQVASQNVRQVVVTNFPPLQQIHGDVSIDSPIPVSEMVRFENIVVPPVDPTETTRLVEAGTLETDGFPTVVLSLHGQVKGNVKRKGTVGAILIPVEQTIQEAFDELGMMHFSLETAANGVSSNTPYFASAQPRYTIGFQAYNVLLYNTTDKTVTVNLYAYLTD